METITVLKLGEENDSSASNNQTKKEKKTVNWSEFKNSDFGRIVKAAFIATATFWIAYGFLCIAAPTWYFFIKVFLSFLIAALTLSACDEAVLKKSSLGSSVVSFVILNVIILSICHYGGEAKNTDTTKESKEQVTPSPVSENMSDFSILTEGEHVFQLKAGEETPWFGFEQGRIVDYKISSPSFDYQIIISDRTKYEGGPNKAIPEKKNCYYKIKARSPQFVTVVVTNRNS